MGKTMGVLITVTTYGMWLRGDQRGWVEDGRILPADPELHEADRRRLKHPPLRFTPEQQVNVGHAIAEAVGRAIEAPMYALAVESWHTHLVLGPCRTPIGDVVKTIKEAARYALDLGRPLWADGYDKRWCFDLTSLPALGDIRRANRDTGGSGWEGPGPRPGHREAWRTRERPLRRGP